MYHSPQQLQLDHQRNCATEEAAQSSTVRGAAFAQLIKVDWRLDRPDGGCPKKTEPGDTRAQDMPKTSIKHRKHDSTPLGHGICLEKDGETWRTEPGSSSTTDFQFYDVD